MCCYLAFTAVIGVISCYASYVSAMYCVVECAVCRLHCITTKWLVQLTRGFICDSCERL